MSGTETVLVETNKNKLKSQMRKLFAHNLMIKGMNEHRGLDYVTFVVVGTEMNLHHFFHDKSANW